MMLKLLLVLTTFLYSAEGTILVDCLSRVENSNTLAGFTNSKTYVYLKKATTVSIKFVTSTGSISLKLMINCRNGHIKAASRVKRTWVSLGKGQIYCNPGDAMLVVLKGSQVFVNTEMEFNILSKPKLRGYHTVVVKGDNVVEKIALGDCVEYPSSYTTCKEANQFYNDHSAVAGGGGIFKDGFLDGDYPLNCVVKDQKLFGSYQVTQSYDLVCSKKDGQYLMDTKTPIQNTSPTDFIAKCSESNDETAD